MSLSRELDSIVFERVVGSIGASLGPENFASGEHADECWDEGAGTDVAPENEGSEREEVA